MTTKSTHQADHLLHTVLHHLHMYTALHHLQNNFHQGVQLYMYYKVDWMWSYKSAELQLKPVCAYCTVVIL